ncbi:hypothetical protein BCR42DRAFT_395299 [Absidia repens]|uniref:Uncharacterized protein n=1 Tax=Absidia repens TaxID=90262 RepID=A0A1X2I7E8_9FUNG|nr:hypothetical protein BCR42DRAFT_395299 [Absidia repens]
MRVQYTSGPETRYGNDCAAIIKNWFARRSKPNAHQSYLAAMCIMRMIHENRLQGNDQNLLPTQELASKGTGTLKRYQDGYLTIKGNSSQFTQQVRHLKTSLGKETPVVFTQKPNGASFGITPHMDQDRFFENVPKCQGRSEPLPLEVYYEGPIESDQELVENYKEDGNGVREAITTVLDEGYNGLKLHAGNKGRQRTDRLRKLLLVIHWILGKQLLYEIGMVDCRKLELGRHRAEII